MSYHSQLFYYFKLFNESYFNKISYTFQNKYLAKYAPYYTRFNILFATMQTSKRGFRDINMLLPLFPNIILSKCTGYRKPHKYVKSNKYFNNKQINISNVNFNTGTNAAKFSNVCKQLYGSIKDNLFKIFMNILVEFEPLLALKYLSCVDRSTFLSTRKAMRERLITEYCLLLYYISIIIIHNKQKFTIKYGKIQKDYLDYCLTGYKISAHYSAFNNKYINYKLRYLFKSDMLFKILFKDVFKNQPLMPIFSYSTYFNSKSTLHLLKGDIIKRFRKIIFLRKIRNIYNMVKPKFKLRYNSKSTHFKKATSFNKTINRLSVGKYFVLNGLNYYLYKKLLASKLKYYIPFKRTKLQNTSQSKIRHLYFSYVFNIKSKFIINQNRKIKKKKRNIVYINENTNTKRYFQGHIVNKKVVINNYNKKNYYNISNAKKIFYINKSKKNLGILKTTINSIPKGQFMRVGIKNYHIKKNLFGAQFKSVSFFYSKYLQQSKFKSMNSKKYTFPMNEYMYSSRSIQQRINTLAFSIYSILHHFYLKLNMQYRILNKNLCYLYLCLVNINMYIQFIVLSITILYYNKKYYNIINKKLKNTVGFSKQLNTIPLIFWHLLFKNIFFHSVINHFMRFGKKEKMEYIFYHILATLKRKLHIQPMILVFKLFDSILPVFDVYHLRRYRKTHPVPRLLKLRRKLLILFSTLKQVLHENKKIWYFKNKFVAELIKTNFKRSSTFTKIISFQRFIYTVRRNLYFTKKMKRKFKVFI